MRAQPRRRQGGDRRAARSAASPPSTPASCCRRRSSATTTTSSRTPYDPDEAKRLLEEAGVAGETIQLVGESGRWLQGPRAARGRRRLLDGRRPRRPARDPRVRRLPRRAVRPREPGRRDLRVELERPARSRPPARHVLRGRRHRLVEQQRGAGRRSSPPAGPSSTRRPAQTIYEQAVQIAYDEALFVWLVNNEDIYGLSENVCSGRRGSTPSCSSSR